jgi:uracil-DNA glycosylase
VSPTLQYSGPLPTFAATSGPRNAKIALVAESWGQQEELTRQPLIGTTGQELNRMLEEAGISRNQCFATNVFALRPTANKIDSLCLDKKGVGGKNYVLPATNMGKYIEPRFLPELTRLTEELTAVRPNLVIALGAISCWALLQSPKIGSIRGTTSESVLVPGQKVLATYHPSAVYRNWSLRPIVVADLMKAKREAEFPDVRRPQRFVLVRPSIPEMYSWWKEHGQGAKYLAVDIETIKGQIRNIGFAPSRSHAINIPFIVNGASYWPTVSGEWAARQFVQMALESPAIKIGQNFLYDLQYLLKEGFRVNNYREDTMLLHHALYPEMQKGLGFLGSIYSNEPAWKLLRGKTEELKADDE